MTDDKQDRKRGGVRKRNEELRQRVRVKPEPLLSKKQDHLDNVERVEIATKKKQLIQALVDNMGLVTRACKVVGISTRTYQEWMDTDADFAREKKESVELHLLDAVEGKFIKSISDGNISSIQMFMRTRGKSRGYSESRELTGPNGGPIQVEGSFTLQTLNEELPLDALVKILEIAGPRIKERIKRIKQAEHRPFAISNKRIVRASITDKKKD